MTTVAAPVDELEELFARATYPVAATFSQKPVRVRAVLQPH